MIRRWRGAAAAAYGALIAILHVAVVAASLAGPALILLGTVHVGGEWTSDVWRNVFGDLPRWGVLLATTGKVAALATGGAMLLGVTLAVILFRTDAPLRRPLQAIVLLAAAMPVYVVAGAFVGLAGAGPWQQSAVAVALMHALAHLPLVTLIVGVALRSVSADLEEMAAIDGAGRLRTLWSVTLPAASGGLVAAVLLVLLWVTTDYSASDLFQVRTFAEEVYTQYQLHGRAAEAALVCLPQALLFAMLLWRWRGRYLAASGATDDAMMVHGPRPLRLRRWKSAVIVAALMIVAALLLPSAAALFSPLRQAHGILRRLISFKPEIATSLLTSAAAGAMAAALALGLGWYAVRRPRWRPLVTAYVVFMIALPAPVLGVSLIQLFNRPGGLALVYDSPAILVVAYVFRFLPIAVLILIPAVRAIPVECEWAARADGCGSLDLWQRIVWPLCLPGVLVAVFVVTILAIGELPCSHLVTPPGYLTVGSRFFGLLHFGMYPDAAVLCLASIAIVVILAACVAWLLRKRVFT